jgi:hypothetical protein
MPGIICAIRKGLAVVKKYLEKLVLIEDETT